MKALRTIISGWMNVNITIVAAFAAADRKVLAWVWAIQAVAFFPITMLVSVIAYCSSEKVRADMEKLAVS